MSYPFQFGAMEAAMRRDALMELRIGARDNLRSHPTAARPCPACSGFSQSAATGS